MVTTDQLLLTLVCLLYAAMLGEAGVMKLIARSTPEWFRSQFESTWLGKLAPLPLMWWTIAVIEVTVAACFIAALATGQTFGQSETPWMEAGLLLAAALFAGLCFGLRVAMDFVGAANAFYYAAATMGLYTLLRGFGWLAGA